MNTDYTTKITEIFYSVDEFCKPEFGLSISSKNNPTD